MAWLLKLLTFLRTYGPVLFDVLTRIGDVITRKKTK